MSIGQRSAQSEPVPTPTRDSRLRANATCDFSDRVCGHAMQAAPSPKGVRRGQRAEQHTTGPDSLPHTVSLISQSRPPHARTR